MYNVQQNFDINILLTCMISHFRFHLDTDGISKSIDSMTIIQENTVRTDDNLTTPDVLFASG